MSMPASDPIDDRLRELLAVELRLQSRVSQARDDAARRVREAQSDAASRLTDADAAALSACVAAEHADQAAHDAALSAIEAAHHTALASLTRITDDEIDGMARQVLERLRLELGGHP